MPIQANGRNAANGWRETISSKRRAAPSGDRCPCSQARTAPRLSPRDRWLADAADRFAPLDTWRQADPKATWAEIETAVEAQLGPLRVVLLDEVTSAFDPEMVGEALDIIRELKSEVMTMMLSTHQMAFAGQISDRIAFLDAGRIVEIGPPEQILLHPQQERTRQFLERLLSTAP